MSPLNSAHCQPPFLSLECAQAAGVFYSQARYIYFGSQCNITILLKEKERAFDIVIPVYITGKGITAKHATTLWPMKAFFSIISLIIIVAANSASSPKLIKKIDQSLTGFSFAGRFCLLIVTRTICRHCFV
jgi:hypothetical protein